MKKSELEKLSKKELKEFALENNLEVDSSLTKNELFELISNSIEFEPEDEVEGEKTLESESEGPAGDSEEAAETGDSEEAAETGDSEEAAETGDSEEAAETPDKPKKGELDSKLREARNRAIALALSKRVTKSKGVLVDRVSALEREVSLRSAKFGAAITRLDVTAAVTEELKKRAIKAKK